MVMGDGESSGRARFHGGVLAFAVLVAAVRLFRMLEAAGHGVDFTDEGYYLAWIRDPFAYPLSVTQFGFLYHPVYEWLGGDVVRLRQGNILLTWVLAWVLVLAFFRSTQDEPRLPGAWRATPMLALAAVLATTFPNLLGQWLVTPSYNSLALQAALVVGIGLLLSERRPSAASLLGWVLLGVGGWLAFLAKPSTAAALGLTALVYLLVARRFHPGWIVASVLTTLLLLGASAWAIDGSAQLFVRRLAGGLEMIRMMGVEQPLHRLFRIDSFRIGGGEFALLLVLLGLLMLAMRLPNAAPGLGRRLGDGVLLVLVVASLLLVTGVLTPDFGAGRFRGLSIWAVTIAAVITALWLQRKHWAGGFAPRHMAPAVAFLLIPHAVAFGTGNNYWLTGVSASLFWILSGAAVLAAAVTPGASWRVFLPTALGAQLVGVLAFHAAASHPYRHPQVLENAATEVRFGERGTVLRLGSDYAAYVSRLGELATIAGFRAGTPMIDLTGQSPGALFSLGAQAVGQPWLLGGYPGSDGFAIKALRDVPCEVLAPAWILTEPLGPRPLSAKVASAMGIDVEHDYVVAGSVDTPPGFGDYAKASPQFLLKPARPAQEAAAACRKARESGG